MNHSLDKSTVNFKFNIHKRSLNLNSKRNCMYVKAENECKKNKYYKFLIKILNSSNSLHTFKRQNIFTRLFCLRTCELWNLKQKSHVNIVLSFEGTLQLKFKKDIYLLNISLPLKLQDPPTLKCSFITYIHHNLIYNHYTITDE